MFAFDCLLSLGKSKKLFVFLLTLDKSKNHFNGHSANFEQIKKVFWHFADLF